MVTNRAHGAYMHPQYADAFDECGILRRLPRSGTWLLQRHIAGGGEDAMGPYPILMCRDWSQLRRDLDEIRDLIAVSAVIDPFASIDAAELALCFPHLIRHFKDHYVADLIMEPDEFVGAQHRRYARRALRAVDVQHGPASEVDAIEFAALYGRLVERHSVRGLTRFSLESLASQLLVPDAVAFQAHAHGRCVGVCIWYAYEDRAYYHLAAYDEVGYALRASYALFWKALEYFRGRVRWLSFGGGAGAAVAEDDGLAQFKRGWSSSVRPAYLCGRIIDAPRYAAKCSALGIDAQSSTYFPAYRDGEL